MTDTERIKSNNTSIQECIDKANSLYTPPDAVLSALRETLKSIIDRSITEIEIPKGVTTIGKGAFEGCRQVTGRVTVPEGIVTIDENAFSGCDSITELVLPDSLTSLAWQCFLGMESLKKLVLPPRVTVLPVTMASSCLSMTEFVALGDITKVSSNSLQVCYSCLSFDFTACTSVPVLQNTNAFIGINAEAKIYVPATLYDEWIAATNWAVLADYIVAK